MGEDTPSHAVSSFTAAFMHSPRRHRGDCSSLWNLVSFLGKRWCLDFRFSSCGWEGII